MTNRTYGRVIVELVVENIHKDTIDFFMEEVWAALDNRLSGHKVIVSEQREGGE